MIDDKIKALKNMIESPSDLNGLLKYERKLRDASIDRLSEIRALSLRIMKSGKKNEEITTIFPKIKDRIDSLIEKARKQANGLTPGISEEAKKHIIQNAILYNLIIFSHCWDLKDNLSEIDSKVVFQETNSFRGLLKAALDTVHSIDDLFTGRENSISNVIPPEEVASNLSRKFKKELKLVEKSGALKGVITLDKPKLFGKSEYYDTLGNILLKIALSFGPESHTEEIAVRALVTRLKDEYPQVKAETSDVNKAIDKLAENGLIILKEDDKNLRWIQLHPTENESNAILALAKDKGFITLDEVMLQTKWSQEKATEEIEKFIKAGCAVVDSSYAEGPKYYFPGLLNE
ncbi:MAG: hypothetical protein GF308_05550 [Candidatus Heimdallarchaeota archaeon]|nr:hypothetical protein [Candidatus Heimdallarchaeota archaeon]